MDFIFVRKYLSIEKLQSKTFNDFNIITGLNGAGKTQFLEALNQGSIIVKGVPSEQIVYFNYNDFSISGDKEYSRFSKNNRVHYWDQDVSLFYEGFKKSIIQASNLVIKKTGNKIDKWYLSLARVRTYNIKELIENEEDFKLIEKLESTEKNIMAQGKYTSEISNLKLIELISVYTSENADFTELQPEIIRYKFEQARKQIEDEFLIQNKDLAKYIFTNIAIDSIFDFTIDDIQSPFLFLEDLIKEEKNYQILKVNNYLNEVKSTKYDESISYLKADEFISKYGLSPVESINEILKIYNTNGYSFETNKLILEFGVRSSDFEFEISLSHKQKGFNASFDTLSSGEKTLIALSFMLYKLGKQKIIPQILLLDEIDSALHPSKIQRLLSVIQNSFIKKHGLKIILATHSPTTIALSPDNCTYILKNSNGVLNIENINKDEAIQILTEGFWTFNEDDQKTSIGYNIENTSLPVMLTEGITDKIIIETAWNKLYNSPLPFYLQECFDAKFLGNLINRGYDNQDGIIKNNPDQLFFALFDFDSQGYNVWNGLNKIKVDIESNPQNGLCRSNEERNCFAFLLPVSENAEVAKLVMKNSTETFKDKSRLTIEHLFYGEEGLNKFFHKTTPQPGAELIEFKNGKKKREFAKKVSELPKESFTVFESLFDRIKDIIDQHKAR
ncbi:MAG: AAA15 family ATPase/GTPase [Crocinitomicaceae bacterium]|jgi:AAA15 family ATPase/GTPase